jgi:hypothetical protein
VYRYTNLDSFHHYDHEQVALTVTVRDNTQCVGWDIKTTNGRRVRILGVPRYDPRYVHKHVRIVKPTVTDPYADF